ncbi:hypothetical protein ACFLZV_07160 [Candidatus Margulisiibacteriota bacterium]
MDYKQKELWKKEKEQLKKDRKKCKKVYKKREVPIRVCKKCKPKKQHEKPLPKGNNVSDDLLRRNLGL